MDEIISVFQLNKYVKSLLDCNSILNDIYISGEISNFKNHYSSGHWYFTLKDEKSSVPCVMFSFNNSRVKFDVEDGQKVVVHCKASVYERDGKFQLYVSDIFPDGTGLLSIKFEQLKAKLEAEGLFNPDHKRMLPEFPKKVGVVTSETGAAFHDILNIMSRRYPICEILLFPALVQGSGAADSMVNALEIAYNRDDIDVIIIGRGGGSAEDLWEFNNEKLARKIYVSPVPVISAVGHEVDFTICDFVSDVRAETPSAAAELATPDCEMLKNYIFKLQEKIFLNLNRKYELSNLQYQRLSNINLFNRFNSLLNFYITSAENQTNLLNTYIDSKLLNANNLYDISSQKLALLNPYFILRRGYSVVTDKKSDVIKSIKKINSNDIIDVKLYDGSLKCKVVEING